jgi:DNA polymerase III alpha subunit
MVVAAWFDSTNQEYYFKTAEEMKRIFADLPEAICIITEN